MYSKKKESKSSAKNAKSKSHAKTDQSHSSPMPSKPKNHSASMDPKRDFHAQLEELERLCLYEKQGLLDRMAARRKRSLETSLESAIKENPSLAFLKERLAIAQHQLVPPPHPASVSYYLVHGMAPPPSFRPESASTDITMLHTIPVPLGTPPTVNTLLPPLFISLPDYLFTNTATSTRSDKTSSSSSKALNSVPTVQETGTTQESPAFQDVEQKPPSDSKASPPVPTPSSSAISVSEPAQLRDLHKSVVRMVPSAVLKKRKIALMDADDASTLQTQGENDNGPTELPNVDSKSSTLQTPASTTQTSEKSYSDLMAELEHLS